MREDAADTFVRARDNLLVSINDFTDIESSLVEYTFAKANLDLHEFELEKTWKEDVCDFLADSIIKNESGFTKTKLTRQQKRELRSARHQGHASRRAGSPSSHWHKRIVSHVEKDLPLDDREEHIKHRLARSHGYPFQVQADLSRHFGDSHPLDRKHNPLNKIEPSSGLPWKYHILAKRFLPPVEGKPNRASKVKSFEIAVESWLDKNTPHTRTSTNKLSSGKTPFLGSLHTGKSPNTLSHEEDMYQRDFERWKEENDDGLSSDFDLRKRHFADRMQEWQTEEVTPEFEGGVDPLLADYYGIASGTPKDLAHPSYLSDLAWHMGLEWLSPEERTKVFEHLIDKTSDSKDQFVKFDDNFELPMGRLKRNMRMRATNMLGHVENSTIHSGPNNVKPNLFHSLQPEIYEESSSLLAALHSAHIDNEGKIFFQEGEETTPLVERAIENIHDALGLDEEFTGSLSHIPKLTKSDFAKLKRDLGEGFGDSLFSTLKEKEVEKKEHSKESLLYSLGFDKNGKEIEAGEHHYPNHSGPLIDSRHMNEILDNIGDFQKIGAQRGSIEDGFSFFSSNKPHKELLALPPEIQDAVRELGGVYPANDFATAFLGPAAGIDRHIFAEALLGPTMVSDPSYGTEEGLFANIDGTRFSVKDGLEGLFGFLIHPHPESSTLSLHSLQHPKRQLSRSKRLQNTNLTESTHPNFIDALSGLTPQESLEKFGKSTTAHMVSDWLNSKHKDSRQPYGGQISMGLPEILDPDMLVTDYDTGETRRAEEIYTKTFDNQIYRDSISGRNALHEANIMSRINGDHKAKLENKVETSREIRSGPFNDKLDYDTLTIINMVKHLAEFLPPDFLSVDNPKFKQNMAALFADANLALHHLPSEYYEGVEGLSPTTRDFGIEKTSLPVHENVRGLSQKMRDGFIVTNKTSIDDFIEDLGFPNDSEHREHLNKTLSTIPDGEERFIQSVKNIAHEASGIEEDYDSEIYDNHGQFSKYTTIEDRMKEAVKRGKRDTPEFERMGKLRPTEREMQGLIGLLTSIQSTKERNPELAKRRIARKVEELGIDADVNNLDEMISAVQGKVGELITLIDKETPFEYKTSTPLSNLKKVTGIKDTAGFGEHGLSLIEADMNEDGTTPFTSSLGHKYAKKHQHGDAIHASRGLILYDGTQLPDDHVTERERAKGSVVQPITSFNEEGAKVTNIYGASHKSGVSVTPQGRFSFETGTPTFHSINQTESLRPANPSHVTAAFGVDYGNQYALTEGEPLQQPLSNVEIPTTALGQTSMSILDDPARLLASEPAEYAVALLNPDSLLKGDKEPSWIPPIRPMHRIFKLKQLQELRGFTGSWAISKYYEGKRLVLTKKGNRVTAYDESGTRTAIPDWARSGVKNLGEKDCTLDGVLTKENLHISDILHYDGSDVMEMTVRERFKILRGQFDSHEKVLIAGPHDTRFTDDEGLKDAVETLLKEHSAVILKDGKSTYMRGEKRHPKWVLLRRNKDMNLVVLDRRGNNPYTYRLGAGPVIDSEGLGNRAVEKEGETFVDVGTVTSNKPFEEGDVVRVRFSGVSRVSRYDRDVYDVQISRLVGEGEGEGGVSMETLSIIAKALPPIHVPHDIDIEDDKIKITLPQDEVYYTLNKSSLGYWVDSPITVLSDVGLGDYSIELSESLKPYWGQVASLMLKGKVEKLPIETEEAIPSEEETEHRKKISEEQSAGILKPKDESRLLKPKMQKALEVMERAMDLIEKEQMFNTTGAKGMGIDVGTPNSSPRGPTTLNSEQTVPDWDMRERSTEDPEEPYPKAERKRLKEKKQKLS